MPTETDGEETPTLRQRAEQRVTHHADPAALSPDALRGLLHELQVHQIELEMQNEELRRAQMELDAARTRYFELYDLAPIGYLTLSSTGLIQEANLMAGALLRTPRRDLVGGPLARFILPRGSDEFYRHHRQLLHTGEPQTCDVRLSSEGVSAAPKWVRLEMAIDARDEPDENSCRITLSDITDRKQAEDALQLGEERLQLALNASHAGTWDWNMSTGQVRVDDGWLDLLGDSPGEGAALSLAFVQQYIHPDDRGASQRVMRDCLEGRLSEYQGEHRFVTKANAVRWHLVAGKVVAWDADGKPARMVGTSADVTERKQVESAQKDLLLLQEQQRIARDLHDSVMQGLFAAGLTLTAALNELDRNPEKARSRLARSAELVKSAATELREFIFGLRLDRVGAEGLVAALARRLDSLPQQYSAALEASFCAEPNLPLPAKEAFYHIALEALNNAANHAHAQRIRLELSCTGDEVVLSIKDDGQGFDSTQARPGHLGLLSMRERAHSVGAHFTIESAPGQGTRVRAAYPLHLR